MLFEAVSRYSLQSFYQPKKLIKRISTTIGAKKQTKTKNQHLKPKT